MVDCYARIAVVAAALLAWSPPLNAEPAEGLTLEQVIDRARHGARADAARHNTKAAQARTTEAKGAWVPKIEVTGFIAPSPEIECANADCTQTTNRDASVDLKGVFGGVRLQLVQPIYTFGKSSAVGRAARLAASSAEHLEDVLAGTLAVQAARSYYGVTLARELIWMLEDGKEEIAKAQKRLEKQLDEGTGAVTIQDRQRIQVLSAEVDARLTEAREAESTALAGLRALLSDATADLPMITLDAVDFDVADDSAGYVVTAKSDRPDLKAAKAGANAAKAIAQFQQNKWWPDLVVVAGLNVARATSVDDAPSAFARDPFNVTSAAVGLALRWKLDPVGQLGRSTRASEQAKQAASLVSAAGDAATFDVQRAHAQALQSKKRLAATRTGEKSARGWVAAVLQSDAIGTSEAKDLADAYIAYFEMRARVLQTTYDWNVATIRLRQAIGEFRAPPDRQ
jgi:outer membrane protein TolC